MKFILKTRRFSRWMKKTTLTDAALYTALEEMERGLIDANLGGYIFKKRIALPGRGKSGSVRTLIATKKENRWIFMFGFEKNEKDNITQAELLAIQGLARDYLEFSDEMLLMVVASGQLEQVQ